MSRNMAENVLDSGGPPSAKRPKLSSPALSASASDGNDFGSLFDLEHDLPDELISSNDASLVNGGDLSQLHTSLGAGAGLGPVGGLGLGLGSVQSGQDAVAKHKQLSELLRSGAPSAQGHSASLGGPGPHSASLSSSGPHSSSLSNTGPHSASLSGLSPHSSSLSGSGPAALMKASPQGAQMMGQQQQQHLSPQQLASMMQPGGAMMNRAMMGAQQKNGQQPQQPPMMGNQVVNGSPRMGFVNQAMGGTNLLAETLQGPGGQAGARGQGPAAMNKILSLIHI